jgi:mono/diheme cytochrome c family protein
MMGVFAVIGPCGWASADEADDVRAGKELAARACAPCHAMPSAAAEGQSPGPPRRSFQEIARSDKAAPDSLWSFLKTTHNSISHPGNMPSPELTEQQIRLIYAYIASLRAAH